MTIAEQIKAGFAAAIADFKASFGKTETTTEPEKGKGAPAGDKGKPEGQAAGAITEEIMAAITAELKAQMTPLQEQLNAANTKVTELQGQITDKDAKIKDLEAKEQDLDKRAAEKARALVAGQGVNVDQLPAGKDGGNNGADPKAKANQEYARLLAEGKSLEAGQYWQKNRELLS